MKTAAVFGLLVAVGLLTRFANPVQSDYSSYSLSANNIVGRAFAPFAPELPLRSQTVSMRMPALLRGAPLGGKRSGTKCISSPGTTMFGFYGLRISDLESAPRKGSIASFALLTTCRCRARIHGLDRSSVVHNLFQFSLALLLWRAYCLTGQPFGLCFWVSMMVKAQLRIFSKLRSVRFLYLIIGMCLAPLLQASKDKDLVFNPST